MMLKRVVTKIGDVFSVKIDERNQKFFQLIAFDLTQLNSDVIRAFKTIYPIDSKPDLSEIVKGEVEFYAHCVTKWGVKMDLWEKVGHINEVGSLDHILFRDTNDYGAKPDGTIVNVSDEWYVWHINDEDFTHIGKLFDKYRKAEVGLVINPVSIAHRIRTGEYDRPFFF
jgi:hypothetical protein